ncbi:hypothetical protein TREMEDRAFT_62133 [Tremella mesenterica DSM 1558]|uniref:uncharacterized protein n=1 Tax=Tremella mesenterica (strain ATCC 24925 / CBS 8224 / DSM 1558 / NBRC 9311 / NRRL Y-6157 / RJB 2259-6 / UBC 559-6) TaxID=578456 RepID=UPI0003F48E77|nr:uncharacterized protein TREMEDRAFT_62133 [Tremella mesenterica DSM 1558]EIW69276.1 hypothetical protein TREMEDRAFT_62133 [Tremella mesenterica DSM 1558]
MSSQRALSRTFPLSGPQRGTETIETRRLGGLVQVSLQSGPEESGDCVSICVTVKVIGTWDNLEVTVEYLIAFPPGTEELVEAYYQQSDMLLNLEDFMEEDGTFTIESLSHFQKLPMAAERAGRIAQYSFSFLDIHLVPDHKKMMCTSPEELQSWGQLENVTAAKKAIGEWTASNIILGAKSIIMTAAVLNRVSNIPTPAVKMYVVSNDSMDFLKAAGNDPVDYSQYAIEGPSLGINDHIGEILQRASPTRNLTNEEWAEQERILMAVNPVCSSWYTCGQPVNYPHRRGKGMNHEQTRKSRVHGKKGIYGALSAVVVVVVDVEVIVIEMNVSSIVDVVIVEIVAGVVATVAGTIEEVGIAGVVHTVLRLIAGVSSQTLWG